jgi:hypothetical protein
MEEIYADGAPGVFMPVRGLNLDRIIRCLPAAFHSGPHTQKERLPTR